MIALATPQATPCTSCGTTEGYHESRLAKPRRFNGLPFGVPGPICRNCRTRALRALNTSPRLCDLCGEPYVGKTYDAAEFEDMEGRLCGDCYEDLGFERALLRFRHLLTQPIKHTGGSHVSLGKRPRVRLKRIEDMTPKEACDVIRREFRAMERRVAS